MLRRDATSAARLRARCRAAALRGEVLRDDGQAMVETALSLLATLLLAWLLFESSMMVYTYSVMNDAAREGVRYAEVHGSDSGSCSGPSPGCDASAANVVAVVKSYAAVSFHDISAMTVAVNYPDATQSQPSSLVTVSITYKFIPYLKFPALATSLSLTSKGRIVY